MPESTTNIPANTRMTAAEDAAIAKLWASLNPQKTETYAQFKERDPIGWEEFESLGAAVARATIAAFMASETTGRELEAAVDAFMGCRPKPRVVTCDIGDEMRDTLRQQLAAAFAAVPAPTLSIGHRGLAVDGAECMVVPCEQSDEMLRSSCAVDLPALYRDHLRHPLNGPKSAAETETKIAHERKRWAAILAAVAGQTKEQADV